MKPIYEVPASINELFTDESHYKIVDYTIGEMDNIQAMALFLQTVGVLDSHILLNDGTQVHLSHPNYNYHIVIDSGGLGDMFSHGFEVTKQTYHDYQYQVFNSPKEIPLFIAMMMHKDGSEPQVTSEEMVKIFNFLHDL